MRYLKFTLLLLLPFNVTLYAQTRTTPKFKKVTFAMYDTIGSGTKKQINLSRYLEIAGGKIHILDKLYLGINDTTYNLPDEAIKKLNSVFNGKKKLQSYLAITTPVYGNYSGGPAFVKYTDQNGKSQALTIIDPNMNEDFSKVLDVFYRVKSGNKIKSKAKSIKLPLIEAEILKYHIACPYMINFSDPPTEKQLSGPPTEKN